MSLNRRTFLKELGLGVAGLGFVSSFPGLVLAAPAGARKLPRSAPEAQGISSGAILAFLEAVGQSRHEFHSFMLARHGQVVAEGWWSPYQAGLTHMLYSLSKSFTSTAVGFAVAEGKLKVEDRVMSFFPEDLPGQVSENLAAVRVKDLLTMSVGHAQDSIGPLTGEDNWVKKFLSLPVKNPPGSAFLYNSGATYMLSAIVQKVTGQKIIDYLTPRLFEPLGIRGVTWETCPRGINTGGWGFNIQTEGLAKFGLLYLQRGLWQGRQLLPAAWIEEATTAKIMQPAASEADRAKSDWLQGYGYQFWRCRHGVFRGDGAFGQYTLVMPDQDAVIAITSETANMQGELDLVWEHLLPAMKEQPLAADKKQHGQLKEKLASLALLPPKGQAASPSMGRVSRKTYQMEANSLGAQNVSFDFQKKACRFILQDDQHAYPVTCGLEKWSHGLTDMPGEPPKLTSGGAVKNQAPYKVAASGTWKDERTFEMTWRFYETPHHDTVTCQFEGDKVQVAFRSSLIALSPNRPDKRPILKGQMSG